MMMWGNPPEDDPRLDVDHTPYSICIPITSVLPTSDEVTLATQKAYGNITYSCKRNITAFFVTFSCPIFSWFVFHVFEVLFTNY